MLMGLGWLALRDRSGAGRPSGSTEWAYGDGFHDFSSRLFSADSAGSQARADPETPR